MDAARTAASEVVLALDVGGSSVKSALVSHSGRLRRGSFHRATINSQGPREDILRVLIEVIDGGLRTAEAGGRGCSGVGIAIPGPFDYRAGVSLMTHKFAALFGANLAAEARARLRLGDEMPIRFVHDAGAFLLGEAWRGAARGYGRTMALTLGTGIGSAFMVGRTLAATDTGMPEHSVWNQPYEQGIVEDAVSAAAILRRYREVTGKTAVGSVKEIASSAIRLGDQAARRVFAEFGATLGLAVRPTVLRLQPEALVLGGQISKSFQLFTDPLREHLAAVACLKAVVPGASIDYSALYGAAEIVWARDLTRADDCPAIV